MPIDFAPDRWERIHADSDAWWRGELDRPLLSLYAKADPGRPEPALPDHWFLPFYGDDVSVDAIIDRKDWALSGTAYVADAFPNLCPNFGAGILAAMAGGSTAMNCAAAWAKNSRPTRISTVG